MKTYTVRVKYKDGCIEDIPLHLIVAYQIEEADGERVLYIIMPIGYQYTLGYNCESYESNPAYKINESECGDFEEVYDIISDLFYGNSVVCING